MYHRGKTEDGELYRTTYVTKNWSLDANSNGSNATNYPDKYLDTLRLGPAHPQYESRRFTVTNETFPDVYQNQTASDDTVAA